MPTLTPLNASVHGDLKVRDDRLHQYAKSRHMIPLNVTEVPQAAMCLPVLISRFEGQNSYALSAITSFEPGTNLFVEGEAWQPIFIPAEMQTFPIGLMTEPDAADPVLGIDPTMLVFSKSDGTALFDGNGQPSLWLSQTEKQLRDHAEKKARTYEFFQELARLDLIVPLNISVHLSGGATNQISGLMSINEDALKNLPPKELVDLSDRGYLPVIYGLLFSLFQLNLLIQKTNERGNGPTIEKIGLELARGPAAG